MTSETSCDDIRMFLNFSGRSDASVATASQMVQGGGEALTPSRYLKAKIQIENSGQADKS